MDIYDEDLYTIDADYEDEIVKHYGTPRHSGRYPWGSGENPYQHEDGWLTEYRGYKAQVLVKLRLLINLAFQQRFLEIREKQLKRLTMWQELPMLRRCLIMDILPLHCPSLQAGMNPRLEVSEMHN